MTGAAALLMYFPWSSTRASLHVPSAPTSLQLFDIGPDTWLVPALGVGLLAFAFLVNILGNRFIQSFSFFTAFLKIGGITLFALGGLWFTVGFAIVATVSGVIASVFAVSRMLAMLTEMELVPHRHFGMPGTIQRHTLVYTVVIAMALTIFFDLSRIASLGAIFYIIMDIAIHWGILRHLRQEVDAKAWVLIAAIVLDLAVLSAFLVVKVQTDMLVIWVSLLCMILIFAGERYFFRKVRSAERESQDNLAPLAAALSQATNFVVSYKETKKETIMAR